MKISLKAARVNAGLTTKEAGELVGKTRQTIAYWENGVSLIPAVELMKLCDVYGIGIENIFLPQKSTKSGESA